MDFKSVNDMIIPEGAVSKIMRGTDVLWEKNVGLPNEYQEVEWVQADTHVEAYIDLGFSYDTGCKIEIGQWVMNDTIAAYPFGATENSGVLRCCISSPFNYKSYFYGSDGSEYIAFTLAYALNELNHITANYAVGALSAKNKTNGKETIVITRLANYVMTNHLYLFAQNYNGSPRFGNIRRISYFRYYDKNDELICDLVPCYRKSDGIIGMYDLVRRLFLTNIGTGTFTKGSDV